MKRLYLDCAASFPALYKKQYFYSNPSSLHREGREAQREIVKSKEYFFTLFGLSPYDYHLIFHSGATEGLQSFILQSKQPYATSIFSHKCLTSFSQASFFDSLVPSKEEAFFSFFTIVPSETGTFLQDHPFTKNVHCDCAQMIGKHPSLKLFGNFDSYTFSAHKFGGPKGLGFSFIKKTFSYQPLFLGSQQDKLRGGTINITGILQTEEALKKFLEKFDWNQTILLKQRLIEIFQNIFSEEIEFPFAHHSSQAAGIFSFYLKNIASEKAFIHFDQEGLAISLGQACSLGEDQSLFLKELQIPKPLLRISPSPFLQEKDINFLYKTLKVIKRKLL